MTEIRKGYCSGCPYDWGAPMTDYAYNLGCLPHVAEILEHVGTGAWPCHAEPDKVCCGFAARHREQIHGELKPMKGVHS